MNVWSLSCCGSQSGSAEEDDVIFCHFPATEAGVSVERAISSFLILHLMIIKSKCVVFIP